MRGDALVRCLNSLALRLGKMNHPAVWLVTSLFGPFVFLPEQRTKYLVAHIFNRFCSEVMMKKRSKQEDRHTQHVPGRQSRLGRSQVTS